MKDTDEMKVIDEMKDTDEMKVIDEMKDTYETHDIGKFHCCER